jgi:hypothetical protein
VDVGEAMVGERGRPLATHLSEHRHNLRKGLSEKSKLAQHAYEEGHRVTHTGGRLIPPFMASVLTSVSGVILGPHITLVILGPCIFGNSSSVLKPWFRVAQSLFGVF